MNFIMNDLRSSMNIQMLDALIRLQLHDDSFSFTQAQYIISIWVKRGNKRIELVYSCPAKNTSSK